MLSRLAAAALLVALGLAPARAQQGAPDIEQLAAVVQQQPTDARSVNQRFGLLSDVVLPRRGVPLTPEEALALRRVHFLLAHGRLTPAARLLDRFVVVVAATDHAAPRGGPGWLPAPNSAVPAAVADSPDADVLGDTPKLLSTPAGAPLSSAPPLKPADLVGAAASAAAGQAPAPGGNPLPFFILAAVVVGGVATWLAAARSRPAKSGKRAASSPPSRFAEKYELGKAIARGGMGEVFEGKDLTLGRKVAIKRMLPEIGLDAELRRQFVKEAKTVAKLSHPYIVQIHDCVEEGGELYLVFEYVDGEPLSRRLSREARLPLKECRRLFGFVCPAIDHAHKNHVLHRDLKPANIMLDSGGIARVMDFGIALESTRTLTSAGTAPLMVSGTLRYMPPEQHFGRSVRSSDVYAMGVCLYEMATGHPPFTASSVEELLEQKRARRFPAASTLVPGLGKEFDVLIAAVLAPDPGSRVSSAPEFLEALEGLPG